MSDLIRYKLTGYDKGIEPATNGGLVRYRDVMESLEAKDDEIYKLQFALGVCETNRLADAEYMKYLHSVIAQMHGIGCSCEICELAPDPRDDGLDALDRSKEQ